jgi:hypothetical protein
VILGGVGGGAFLIFVLAFLWCKKGRAIRSARPGGVSEGDKRGGQMDTEQVPVAVQGPTTLFCS